MWSSGRSLAGRWERGAIDPICSCRVAWQVSQTRIRCPGGVRALSSWQLTQADIAEIEALLKDLKS